MRRMGLCNRLRPEKVEEYKALHAAVWPDVLARISACNIRNYSIFLRTPENLLFAYWEYHGEDFEADANRAIVRAASQASKAADFLLGFLPAEDDERTAPASEREVA